MPYRSRPTSRAACLLLCLLCLACGGGGGDGGGPSQPSGNLVTITVTVSALTLGADIHEAALSLDGTEIGRRTWDGGCAGGCQLTVMRNNVPAGSHTIAFTVVRQSRAVVRYAAVAVVVVRDLATGQDRRIDPPRQDTSLRAGESLRFAVTI